MDTKQTKNGFSVRRLMPLAVVVAFGVGLALYMKGVERGVLEAAKVERVDSAGRARPVAEVSRVVRAMKLVTVEVETMVEVRTRDESWMGNVDATVRVPTTLYYGTDLSAARVDVLDAGPLGTEYAVRIPEPRRIATEIYAEREQSEVNAGWLRLKSMAGEKYLGLARKLVSDEARRMVLNPEDARGVREQTIARVRELLTVFVGERARVRVEFMEPGPLAGVGGASAIHDREGRP
ncbi:MAG: hypothetical protein ACT4PL_08710 [Phycisphaerales bacterium]